MPGWLWKHQLAQRYHTSPELVEGWSTETISEALTLMAAESQAQAELSKRRKPKK